MISTSHFHPMLVHFPIALVAIGFLFELAAVFIKKETCLSKAGLYLLIIGTLSAIFAWLSGSLFTSEMSGSAGEVKETHELFASITLGLLVVASVLKITILILKSENNRLKWASIILYALASVSVAITGYFGGTLVYNYMMPL
jgi:uncharacterized membrane protein